MRNREPKWYGIRYNGEIAELVSPWVELSRMVGEDKGRTLRAHAFEIGATLQKKSLRFSPSATLGYAFGSGDKVGGDLIDNRFRQTGYEDNVAYFGGVTQIHYYSEVIDPELSNLAIFTAGIGAMPTSQSSVNLVYHNFAQDHAHTEIVGSNLVDPPARPNGISTKLGSEIDLIFGVSGLWSHLNLSWTLGIFNPGEAFDPFLSDAVLNKFNLIIEL